MYTKGLSGLGLASLIDRGYFESLLLDPLTPYRQRAARSGYVIRGTLPSPDGGVLEIYTRGAPETSGGRR
jgi:hypothetical protein